MSWMFWWISLPSSNVGFFQAFETRRVWVCFELWGLKQTFPERFCFEPGNQPFGAKKVSFGHQKPLFERSWVFFPSPSMYHHGRKNRLPLLKQTFSSVGKCLFSARKTKPCDLPQNKLLAASLLLPSITRRSTPASRKKKIRQEIVASLGPVSPGRGPKLCFNVHHHKPELSWLFQYISIIMFGFYWLNYLFLNSCWCDLWMGQNWVPQEPDAAGIGFFIGPLWSEKK
jgi:hypothetical protein